MEWNGVVSIVGVQMDFSFSIDAVPTLDTVLDFRGLNEGGWRRMEETKSNVQIEQVKSIFKLQK